MINNDQSPDLRPPLQPVVRRHAAPGIRIDEDLPSDPCAMQALKDRLDRHFKTCERGPVVSDNKYPVATLRRIGGEIIGQFVYVARSVATHGSS